MTMKLCDGCRCDIDIYKNELFCKDCMNRAIKEIKRLKEEIKKLKGLLQG